MDNFSKLHRTGTTIPAGTAIMTGTPAGVGWFQNPKCPLKDGDVVEVGSEANWSSKKYYCV
jgi:2-keto-4-pentenoate hydratase/2-oxohepta-3-ene-1,7-dioic acid hydratase in catechol pathway